MSTQPLTEVSETTNTVTKTVEITRTNPDVILPFTKFAIGKPLSSIPKPLSHNYDVVSLLSNYRLYSTWDMSEDTVHTIAHDMTLFHTLAASSLVKYVNYFSGDLQVLIKLVSNAQQVGCMRAVTWPSTDQENGTTILSQIHYPYSLSTVSWELIPFGMNSEHTYTIPWNSVVPYWRINLTGNQLEHGFFRLTTQVQHPIESVTFKPTVQVYIRYVNMRFSAMQMSG